MPQLSPSSVYVASPTPGLAPLSMVTEPSSSREPNHPPSPRKKILSHRLERIERALTLIDQAARKLSDLRALSRSRSDLRLRNTRVRSDLRNGILRDFSELSQELRNLAEDVRALAPRNTSGDIFDDVRLLIELVSHSSETAQALLESPVASKAAMVTLARLMDSLCQYHSSKMEELKSTLHTNPTPSTGSRPS